MNKTQFWVGVVSREHVLKAVESGVAQLNHGKRAPLARMHRGDWIIYYSPRTSYPSGESLQAFTAVGQITSDVPYQVTLSDDFKPFRHDVRYLPCREVPIQDVLENLSFLPDKQHWGVKFRFGHLSIPSADFERITQAIGVTIPDAARSTDVTLSF
jgi:hypothetical protein